MTTPPVIAGTYADLRQVKSRGVWQLVIDVPAEEVEGLVELFGMPRQDQPTHLAVARLKISPGASIVESDALSSADEAGASPQKKPAPAPGETKGGWYGLKPSARAALLCKEPEFWVWFSNDLKLVAGMGSEAEADEWLKDTIGTPKKAWLNPDHEHHRPDALRKFNAIEREYRVSRGMETEEHR